MPNQIRLFYRLATALSIAASILLLFCFFFPFESHDLTPLKMCSGYDIAGGYMAGPHVIIVDSAPFIVGAVVIAAMIGKGRPKVTTIFLLGVSIIWIVAYITYLVSFFQMPSIRLSGLWWIMSLIILPAVTLLILLISGNWYKPKSVDLLLLILGCASLLTMSIAVAFCLIEDGLLLNYGAVVGTASAAVLAVSLLFRYLSGKSLFHNASEIT